MDPTDLTGLDLRVLESLVDDRRTSSVRIAADLWRDNPDVHQHADPVGLVNVVLEGLNERGLVVMSIHDKTKYPGSDGSHETNLVYVDIRLTPAAYAVMGLSVRHREVGRNVARMDPTTDGAIVHPGDPTDFRTQRFRADQTSIESMDIREHIAAYPDHPEHRRQLEEMTMSRTRDDRGVEPYINAAARDASLKEDILRFVVDRRKVGDVDTIVRGLARGGERRTDRHNVQHLLHSLRTQGLVTFRQKTQGSVSTYSAIEPTADGMTRVAMDRTLGGEPTTSENGLRATEEGTMTPDTTTTKDTPRWPVLASIRLAVADAADNTAKADAMRAAAALLDGVDDDTATRLRSTAKGFDHPMTAAEAEYLMYAEEHPDGR